MGLNSVVLSYEIHVVRACRSLPEICWNLMVIGDMTKGMFLHWNSCDSWNICRRIFAEDLLSFLPKNVVFSLVWNCLRFSCLQFQVPVGIIQRFLELQAYAKHMNWLKFMIMRNFRWILKWNDACMTSLIFTRTWWNVIKNFRHILNGYFEGIRSHDWNFCHAVSVVFNDDELYYDTASSNESVKINKLPFYEIVHRERWWWELWIMCCCYRTVLILRTYAQIFKSSCCVK